MAIEETIKRALKGKGPKGPVQRGIKKEAVAGAGASSGGNSSGGNPTSTETSTKTSTVANPVGNITITGGAGRGATTTVTIKKDK